MANHTHSSNQNSNQNSAKNAALQKTTNPSAGLVMTDNQAMHALKEHGGKIVIAIVVILAAYFGWQYYAAHKTATNDTRAADAYQAIVEAQQNGAQGGTKIDEAASTALIDAHPNTVYAWQALMAQAVAKSDGGNYDAASALLMRAEENARALNDAGLVAFTVLQRAQILLAQNKTNEVKTLLNGELPEAFAPSRLELLGDAEAMSGNEDAARAHYQAAWTAAQARSENRALLSAKMQALGILPEVADGQKEASANTENQKSVAGGA